MKFTSKQKFAKNLLKASAAGALFSVLFFFNADKIVFADSFNTGGGRPLSYYGMDAGSALHGASAVPANEIGPSAGQYYNGYYAGNPVYYSSPLYLAKSYPNAFYSGTSYPGANQTGSYQAISPYPLSQDRGNKPYGPLRVSGSSTPSAFMAGASLPSAVSSSSGAVSDAQYKNESLPAGIARAGTTYQGTVEDDGNTYLGGAYLKGNYQTPVYFQNNYQNGLYYGNSASGGFYQGSFYAGSAYHGASYIGGTTGGAYSLISFRTVSPASGAANSEKTPPLLAVATSTVAAATSTQAVSAANQVAGVGYVEYMKERTKDFWRDMVDN